MPLNQFPTNTIYIVRIRHFVNNSLWWWVRCKQTRIIRCRVISHHSDPVDGIKWLTHSFSMERQQPTLPQQPSPFVKQAEAETVHYQTDSFTLTEMTSPALVQQHHTLFAGHHPDQFCEYALNVFDLSRDDPKAIQCLKDWQTILRKNLRIFHLHHGDELFLALYSRKVGPGLTALTPMRPMQACSDHAKQTLPATGKEPWFPHLCEAFHYLQHHELDHYEVCGLFPAVDHDVVITRRGDITAPRRANIADVVHGSIVLLGINSHLLDDACAVRGLVIDVTHLPQRKLNSIQTVNGSLLSYADCVTMRRLSTVRGSVKFPHARVANFPALRQVGFDAEFPFHAREHFPSLESIGHVGFFDHQDKLERQ